MKIAVFANDDQFNELSLNKNGIGWIRVAEVNDLLNTEADAFFCLDKKHPAKNNTGKPLFINSVIDTLREMDVETNTFRFNGWNGFIEKGTWEIAGDVDEKALAVLNILQKKFVPVVDEPGLISARIISMIINEAFFAEGEKVSSQKDIDIAMKLGTNYPFGPFEWAEKIGLQNVYALLKKLSATETKYSIAPLLEKKING